MTGEVTLNGRVLPIGGVKQKLLAAHAPAVAAVFIPARNEPDLDDVPPTEEALTVHPVSDVPQILAQALEPATVEPGLDHRRLSSVAAHSVWAATQSRNGRASRQSSRTRSADAGLWMTGSKP